MSVVKFEIGSTRPYAGGRSFGEPGHYSRIDGRVTFAVDPSAAANSGIVDLDIAPRDGSGRVRFWSDVTILLPADPRRGNGTLILDVPNRGNGVAGRSFNRLANRTPGVSEDPGDGFLFRHGFSVVSVAWQSDVVVAPGALATELPVAGSVSEPVVGRTQFEMRPAVRTKRQPFSSLGNVPYPPVDPASPANHLMSRRTDADHYQLIPRDQWRILPPSGVSPAAIEYDAGFEPGHLYLLVYEARDPKVTGAGLLALRDAAAFARSGAGGATGATFDRVIGFGVSQTGRLLRQMLSLGLTADEAGAPAIDGMLVHIAGAVRGEFNHRFATPSSAIAPGFGQMFPFAAQPLTDPHTGETAGLFDVLRVRGQSPKVFFTNSSYEYWNANGASLLHIDPAGTRDLEGDPNERIYLFGGSQHVNGVFPRASELPDFGISARYGSSVVDISPLTRAALMNLDRWLRDGTEPPPSRHPRLDDGTAVTRADVLARFAELPGMAPPDPNRFPTLRNQDMGPDVGRGIAVYPPVPGDAYATFVSAVDADLNETGAVRLPDMSGPVGSHTGWNACDPASGDATVPATFLGLTRYFAPDEEGRVEGDWRPPLSARYTGRDTYLDAVRAEAAGLVAEGYLLAEDIDLVVENCAVRYDEARRVGSSER